MLYVLFLVLAIGYNIRKFRKERAAFLTSLIEAKNSSHREMILGHHFYVFIFEGFLAVIVAHLLSEKAMVLGIPGLGTIYLCLVFSGFYLYQFFIRHIEKQTHLDLFDSFKNHLIKELRVNFAVIMLPIVVYSVINWAFQDSVYQEWGSFWFLGLLFNIIFVSVLTISCTVIIMMRLIPNREIIEPEYLDLIHKRLHQINQPHIRIRWIETDIKNAFVVGLKLLSFSNQTLFIGRSLRTTLSLEEFDAVMAHELGHVANRHIQKRLIDFMKNFISVIIGTGIILFLVLGLSIFYWGDDSYLHTTSTTLLVVFLSMVWFIFNYSLLFDTIRSHEFEADGYAVMVLGANFSAFKSAIEKLSTVDELPEYLKLKIRQNKKKGPLSKWIFQTFSTHPDNSLRISFLDHKITQGLPFNHFISTPRRLRTWLSHLLHWKISLPLTAVFLVTLGWTISNLRTGMETISFINTATTEEIISKKELISKINSRPQLVGQTLMYFVVRKNNERLIDHFLSNGAEKGKTLMYISQLKNYEIFQKYYILYQQDLSEDDYFLVLRKTAQVNFTQGYRLLVNARRFEDLRPTYKEDVTRLYETNKGRMPASVQEK